MIRLPSAIVCLFVLFLFGTSFMNELVFFLFFTANIDFFFEFLILLGLIDERMMGMVPRACLLLAPSAFGMSFVLMCACTYVCFVLVWIRRDRVAIYFFFLFCVCQGFSAKHITFACICLVFGFTHTVRTSVSLSWIDLVQSHRRHLTWTIWMTWAVKRCCCCYG